MIANGHTNTIKDPKNGASGQEYIERRESRDEMGPQWTKYARRISSWALGVRDVRQGTGDGKLNTQGATTLI